MPTYDYDCPRCGSFEKLRTVSQRDAPAACPVCGADCARAFGGVPLLVRSGGGSQSGEEGAERGAGSYQRMRRHPKA
jgi:putative FmdB family regulatory protein